MLKCDPNERTKYPVTLAGLPAEIEASLDGFTWGATYAGVVSSGTIVRIRPKLAFRNTTLPFDFDAVFGSFETIPDTTGPILSGALTAAGAELQVTLGGTLAAQDISAIAKWQVSVDGGAYTDIPNSASMTMPSTVLAATAGAHSYTVRAVDTLGNPSSESNAAAATVNAPADTTAPSLLGSLTLTPGNGQVGLDWQDATDAVGVTGYNVEYKRTADSSWTAFLPDPTSSSATPAGLTNGTPYDFRVQAYDAAGNTSAYLTGSATPTNMQTVTLTPIADGLIGNVAGGVNYGATATTWIGDAGGTAAMYRTLDKYDLSSLAGKTIASAKLQLFNHTAVHEGDAYPLSWTLNAHRVLRNWAESLYTSDVYTTGAPWSAPGCGGVGSDRAEAVSASGGNLGLAATNGFVDLTGTQLLTDIQNMINGLVANYGWIIISPTIESTPSVTDTAASGFYMKEHTEADKRPRLVVTCY